MNTGNNLRTEGEHAPGDLDEALKQAARERNKDAFVTILRNTELTLDTYNNICRHLPHLDSVGDWIIEGIGSRLWDEAQSPHRWQDWGGLKITLYGWLDMDAFLAASCREGKWFDYFRFRWEERDGSFVERWPEHSECNRSTFFTTVWGLAVANSNTTVLQTLFNHPQWRAALVEQKCLPLFEASSPEVCALLLQSKIIPFQTILNAQLKRGREKEILQVLLNDSQAAPEFVAQQYIKNWNTLYYDQDFSKTLNEFIQNCAIQHDLDAFHHTVVQQCFIKHRRDLPTQDPELFVKYLTNTPLLDDVKFVCAMLSRIDQLDSWTRWPQILEIFVNGLSENDWNGVVEQHPNTEFLRGLPRWQKHILLQNIDLHNHTVRQRKI